MAIAGSVRCLLMLTVSGLTAAAQIAQSPAFELPGDAPVFTGQAEIPKSNVSTMGLRISSTYDDNALSSRQDLQPDFAAFVQPHLGWRISSTRIEWMVDYRFGLGRSQRFPANDLLSHLFDGGGQVKLTKRLRFLLHETFLSSTNPFDQLQASEPATGQAASTVPRETATALPTEVRTEQASADVVYVLSAHSRAGIGGEFFGARYSLPSGASSSNQVLQDSSSAAGHSYYMRQVSRHQWASVDYRWQRSIFNSGQSSSLVHSLAYTHSIAMSPAVTLSLFAGPERSVAQGVPNVFSPLSTVFASTQSAWQWSGGVTGRWSGKRSSVSANVSRRIDNGGLLGAAQLSACSAEASRILARQWTARLVVSCGRSEALLGPGTLSYVSGAAGLTRTLSPNLLVEFQYFRVQMSSNGSLPASLLADHNRISMSLVYEHQRPLGR
jgi:hypothetical protein